MKQKILVIEDELDILDSISILLKNEGYDFFGAENGENGLELAESVNPDLILCDISMPGISGYGVLKGVRSNPELAHTPFIFLTARTSKKERREGMALGADDYITKPCSNDYILEAIETTLKKHGELRNNYKKKIEDFQADIASTLPKELRNPISSIIGFAKMIESNCEELSNDDIRMMSNNIFDQSSRLLHLISNYTYYIKLFDERQLSHKRDFTISPEAIVKDFARNIAEKYDRPGDLIVDFENHAIKITEEHLIKVVTEITDNAFKFSEKGDKVKIIGHDDREGNFMLSLENQGSQMTPDQIDSIAPFRKFDEARQNDGSGLGLAISIKIVEVSHGEFSIESNGQDEIIMKIKLALHEEIYDFD